MNTNVPEPTVLLVDDDASVVSALSRGLAAEGFSVRSWTDPVAFLREHNPAAPGCLITDLAMPSLSGLELQRELSDKACLRPSYSSPAEATFRPAFGAMRAGAITFLSKPVSLADLVAAAREAIDKDAAIRESRKRCESIDLRLNTLTPREREVLSYVLNGKMNKQIAASLGAAEKTIKLHRARVMRKMHVRSVAELVRVTAQIRSTGARQDGERQSANRSH